MPRLGLRKLRAMVGGPVRPFSVPGRPRFRTEREAILWMLRDAGLPGGPMPPGGVGGQRRGMGDMVAKSARRILGNDD